MTKKILVCTRGKKCSKRGSKGIFEIIAGAAESETKVVPSKCLGMCKRGPAVVVMPGKLKFRKVSESDALSIAQGNFSENLDSGKKKKKKKEEKKRRKKEKKKEKKRKRKEKKKSKNNK